MTPEQQQALEALAGRALTAEEVDEITLLLEDRRDVEIAEVLSRGRVQMMSISKATFQMWCGKTQMRAAIEDHALNVQSPLRSIALTLKDFLIGPVGTIDFNEQANRTMLMAWQYAQAITEAEANELLDLASQPDPVLFPQVSAALNIAEKRRTV